MMLESGVSQLNERAREVLEFCLASESPETRFKVYSIIKLSGLDPSDPLYVGEKPADVECTEYPDGKQDRSAMTYYQSSHGHNMSVINGIFILLMIMRIACLMLLNL